MMAEETEDKLLAAAKKSVFNYLKYRPRSEKEIVDKLSSKGFPNEIIQDCVRYFKKTGSINDALFAKGWARSRLNKPLGARLVKMELIQKGISDDLIRDAIHEATEDYQEHEAILQLARRRLTQYRHLDQTKGRRRLYEFLVRRGFNIGEILKVINEIT
ncbi:MAG: regulatory protein RecX [Candidatus Omnitrophota bacterium]